MNTLIAITAAAVAVALVALVWAFLERRRAAASETRVWEVREKLALAEARTRDFEDRSAAQSELLRAQAAQSANVVAEELLKRADETFRNRELLAQQKLEAQLKPMTDKLSEFAAHVKQVEEKRIADGTGLKAQIEQLLAASTATQDEARKLSSALKRGAGLQGRWGEQMLRNVLELAGLRSGVDFEEQLSAASDEGAQRPDVVVRLPGGGLFVIDSKVSLNDYLASVEATDDLTRETSLKAHGDSVRRHVQQLSSKAYWARFDKPPHSRSPDVVVLFMPLESAFACLSERHPELVAEAWEKKVAIVTPMALFPLLRAVAYGWRAEDQAANAREIAEAGRELHKRVSLIAKYAQDLGGALDKAVEKYNDFSSSLERNVVTQARRFEALAVQSDRTLVEPSEVSARARQLTKLAPSEDQDDAGRSGG